MKKAEYELLPPFEMRSRVYTVFDKDGRIMYQGPEQSDAKNWYNMPEAQQYVMETLPMPEKIRKCASWADVDPAETLMLVPREIWAEISNWTFNDDLTVTKELALKYPYFTRPKSGTINQLMHQFRGGLPTWEFLREVFPWAWKDKPVQYGSENNTAVPVE